MNDNKSGFMSNRYAYEPLDNPPYYQEPLATLGEIIGGSIGGITTGPLKVVAEGAGGTIGEAIGNGVGVAVDNSDAILSNVETFLTEINDWKSWRDVIQEWSGTYSPWN